METATCELCEGRGWVVEADGRAGAARRCVCVRERVVPELLDVAGIPPRYRGCTLANFEVTNPDAATADGLLAARAASQRYVDQYLSDDGGFAETGLLYVGPPGAGKTHLATAVLGELIRRYQVRGLFVDFTALIHRIQSTFDPTSQESKRDVLDPVIEAEALVLDELGAQKPTPWVNEVLYLVMNARYTQRRTTLFTTNYRLHSEGSGPESLDRPPIDAGLPPLASRIPANLLSRLYEMARPVAVEATDFRRDVKLHRHRV